MKNFFDSKPKIYVVIAIALILLFGVLKPLIDINSTKYFFGMVDKQPKEYEAKGILKQAFRLKVQESENGMVYQPFGDFIKNLKADFNPNTPIFSEDEFNQRWWFDTRTFSKVVDKMKFVSCEKGVVHIDVGYRCKFVLDDLSNTGLYEEMVSGKSKEYELSLIIQDNKYQLFNFR